MKNIPGGCCSRKRSALVQIENDVLMERYLYTGTHEDIIPDKVFTAVQEEKQRRSKTQENSFVMNDSFKKCRVKVVPWGVAFFLL